MLQTFATDQQHVQQEVSNRYFPLPSCLSEYSLTKVSPADAVFSLVALFWFVWMSSSNFLSLQLLLLLPTKTKLGHFYYYSLSVSKFQLSLPVIKLRVKVIQFHVFQEQHTLEAYVKYKSPWYS